MLQQQMASEEPAVKFSEPTMITVSKEGPTGSIKANGFNSVPPFNLFTSYEENGSQLNQTTEAGKLG